MQLTVCSGISALVSEASHNCKLFFNSEQKLSYLSLYEGFLKVDWNVSCFVLVVVEIVRQSYSFFYVISVSFHGDYVDKTGIPHFMLLDKTTTYLTAATTAINYDFVMTR